MKTKKLGIKLVTITFSDDEVKKYRVYCETEYCGFPFPELPVYLISVENYKTYYSLANIKEISEEEL